MSLWQILGLWAVATGGFCVGWWALLQPQRRQERWEREREWMRRRAAENTRKRVESDEKFWQVMAWDEEGAWKSLHVHAVIPTAERLIEDKRNPRSG